MHSDQPIARVVTVPADPDGGSADGRAGARTTGTSRPAPNAGGVDASTTTARGIGGRFARGQWLITALFVIVVIIAAAQFTSPSAVGLRLAGLRWDWMLVALLAQFVCIALFGGLYRHAFRSVGMPAGARRMVSVLLASIFVKTVVPLGGASSMAVFVDDADSRGQSGARAAAGTIAVTAIDLTVALPVIVFGGVVLALRGQLAPYLVVGAAMYIGVVAVLIAGLALAGRHPAAVARALRPARSVVNAIGRVFRRPEIVSLAWVQRQASQFAAAAAAIPHHWHEVALAAGFSLAQRLVNGIGLWALFLALGRPADPTVVLAGLGASIVFFVVAIVPDGNGAVEGAMALTFVGLGVDATTAVMVTLAYRLLNVWLPVILGFFAARRLRLFSGQTPAPASA